MLISNQNMFKFKNKSGYSSQLFQEIFGNEKTAIVLSPEPNIRMKYVDNSPTNEIDSYRYWFVIKDNSLLRLNSHLNKQSNNLTRSNCMVQRPAMSEETSISELTL